MAGYSGTPLIQKLGIKAGMTICVMNAPNTFFKILGELPPEITSREWVEPGRMNYIHFFTREEKELRKEMPKLMEGLVNDGMIWISWPKKSAMVQTDVDENVIRKYAFENGLVDVKVCAIDETWTGLKLVIPVKNR